MADDTQSAQLLQNLTGNATKSLRRQGKYQDVPHIDLILMDLNMPGTDGREVLAAIKSDPRLRSTPVTILSTSEAQRDILDGYDLHAHCYIVKPVNLEQLFKVVRYLEEFWLTIVRLPGK